MGVDYAIVDTRIACDYCDKTYEVPKVYWPKNEGRTHAEMVGLHRMSYTVHYPLWNGGVGTYGYPQERIVCESTKCQRAYMREAERELAAGLVEADE